MNNKYGICQWCLPAQELANCEFIANVGLDIMELSYEENLLEQAYLYKKEAERLNISFPTLGMNIFCENSYLAFDSENMFLNHIEKAIKIAKIIGIKTIQIPAFYASEIKTTEDLKIAAKKFQIACDLDPDIYIGTENALNKTENEKLFKLVNRENFKFYFDTQNLKQMKNIENYDVLEAMKDKLIEVHVKDSKLNLNKWAVLGEGDTGFLDTINHLKILNYRGNIYLENDYSSILYASKTENPLLQIANDLKIIKNLFEN